MLCLSTLAVNAEVYAQSVPWHPPKDYVDPVTLKIREFKAQGMNDAQITSELEKLGMGWYPKTGATWIGTRPTSEELERMPPMMPPFEDESSTSLLSRDYIGALQFMQTPDFLYSCISNNMKPGSIAAGTGATLFHFVTTHIGRAISPTQPCWVEVGVWNDTYFNRPQYYTCDNDEDGNWFHGYKTNVEDFDWYEIWLPGTYESAGWVCWIFINGNFVRKGHLAYFYNQVNEANEIFCTTGQWTNDNTHAIFKDSYLWSPGGSDWIWWNTNVPTDFLFDPYPCPVHETHYVSGGTYTYETWTWD